MSVTFKPSETMGYKSIVNEDTGTINFNADSDFIEFCRLAEKFGFKIES